jgi:hypothetical protein
MSDGDGRDEVECPRCGFHERHSVSFRDAGDPLVTIIGFWPIEEKNHQEHDDFYISRCHYRTVCCHAHWDLQIIMEPGEARIPKGIPVVGVDEPYIIEHLGGEIPATLEPKDRIQELEDFMHPPSATYILGNTHYQRPTDHFECDHLVGITMDDLDAASHSPFYGNQMAAMIWYDRKLKRSNYRSIE